jgi:hypothetical protein
MFMDRFYAELCNTYGTSAAEAWHLASRVVRRFFGNLYGVPASTDLFLALALAMAFFTPCSAILTQSYGKSIRQFWLMFA